MEDFIPFGSRLYFFLLAFLLFARAKDFLSTWIATPNLLLEANPIARRLGWIVILISWGIAFFEYTLMVPANRLGHGVYSTTELKILQEVITLTVFSGFVLLYMGEKLRWNHLAAFLCILAAVAFTFLPRR